jgi:CRISPR-associated protein Cmr2
VQDFIAAARRTRDLWFGSTLLSELSKAVAERIAMLGGELVFPAVPRENMKSLEKDSDFNVANIILAVLPRDANLSGEECMEEGRKALYARWLDFAEEAKRRVCHKDAAFLREDQWTKQVAPERVLEFFAAWTDFDEEHESFAEARKRVMRLLAARKGCRNFEQPCFEDRSLPKSSLDGFRPTVFKEVSREKLSQELRMALRLSEGEQLDAVGVVKRLGGGRKNFPSVSRIAADPWIRKLVFRFPALLNNLCEAAEGSESQERYAPAGLVGKAGGGNFEAFPYEGSLLYPERFMVLLKELGIDIKSSDALRRYRDVLESLPGCRGVGTPSPYLAVLVADGDRMGKLIDSLQGAEQNRELSQSLAGFAEKARSIVREHQGSCVYAGGDDVLAFLPVDTCFACAWELHEAFRDAFEDFVKKMNDTRSAQDFLTVPTLSVGVAVAHMLENFADLLNLGRQAEKLAKSRRKGQGEEFDRDGLGVLVCARGNATLQVRRQWNSAAGEKRLDEWITSWVADFSTGGLPRSFCRDLRELPDLYAAWDMKDDATEKKFSKAMAAEGARLLSRKQLAMTSSRKDEILKRFERCACFEDLRDLVQEVLIARRLALSWEYSSDFEKGSEGRRDEE